MSGTSREAINVSSKLSGRDAACERRYGITADLRHASSANVLGHAAPNSSGKVESASDDF